MVRAADAVKDHAHIPTPDEVIVHERKKPTVLFGFRKGSGVNWKPAGSQRRVRDEATVEWARRMRGES